MSSPTTSSSLGGNRASWQEKLQDHCRAARMHPPVFNIVSDRRGGRTAWSSTVTIENQHISARYWYDGQFVHNAKEDAAEVALQQLLTSNLTPTSSISSSSSASFLSSTPSSPPTQRSLYGGVVGYSGGGGGGMTGQQHVGLRGAGSIWGTR